MNAQPNGSVTASDLEHLRQGMALAEQARGIDLGEVRRAAEQGRVSRRELEQIEQLLKSARPFLRLDIRQVLRQAEQARAVERAALAARQVYSVKPTAGAAPAVAGRPTPLATASALPVTETARPAAARAPEPAPAPKTANEAQAPVASTALSTPTSTASVSPAELIARRHIGRTRVRVMLFLRLAGLSTEIEHLEEIEKRLLVGSLPALHHAALSTRLLFLGVADHCFPARTVEWRSSPDRPVLVERKHVGNRLIAYVEAVLGLPAEEEGQKEFRRFIATMDTLSRWNGRGPHAIRDLEEGDRFFVRTLEALELVGRAYKVARARDLMQLVANHG
jgi:hypothetical protein